MRLLLVSDSGINVNKGGFSQTLYNIFSFAKPEEFLFITSLQANTIAPASPPFTFRVVTYNLELLPFLQNRFGKYFNAFINWFNYSVSYKLKSLKNIQRKVKQFNPDIVVVAPNGVQGILVYHLLKSALKNKKVFPYFMDDWLYQSKEKWLGSNIHTLAKSLLKENTSWLMISQNLADIFSERYNITPAKVFTVHNPVELYNVELPSPVLKKDEYIIAYAGALWQMHFDGLKVMARAIEILQNEKKIKLVIYTGKSNWDWRKNELVSLNVEYGGYIPYNQIHKKLAEADCLLVTSSFTKEWQTHSRGSVQTKLTDYLKAGRLIISCGPSYSANHDFLKQHQCGICIETNNEMQAAVDLSNILDNIEANQQYVQRGYEVLQKKFSFNAVHEKLKKFLAA